MPTCFSGKLVLTVVFPNLTYTESGLSILSHNNFDFNGLNNNPILSGNISQTLIILSIAYQVGNTNAASSAYLNDPANIGPTW